MRRIFSLIKKQYSWAHNFLLHTQLGRFLVVGGGAFIVNAMLLGFFFSVMGLPILTAQLLGAEGTIMFSFVLHHHWTYRGYKKKSLLLRFLEFNVTALTGAGISTASVLLCVQILHWHYLIGLGIGALLAMSWNYFSNLYFVWAKRRTKGQLQTNREEV
jgi:putative flippase GtrA